MYNNKLIYVHGDILDLQQGAIAHGCNCRGAFGGGVAGAIRSKYPQVYAAFAENGIGEHLLGTTQAVDITDNLTIINCYTQLNFGGYGPNAIVAALERSIYAAAEIASGVYGYDHLALPKIGSGLGGLDWDTEVAPVIQKIANSFGDLKFYIYYL